MHQTAPPLDPDKLYRSLNTDLQRRIEAVGTSSASTLQILKAWEIGGVLLTGIVLPLALAWCLL